jgi:hypothetical protein
VGSFRRARNHVTHTKTAQQMFQKVSIRSWLNNSWSRWLQDNLVFAAQTRLREKFRNHCGSSTVLLAEDRVQQNGHGEKGIMDECVSCRPLRGDSGLVAPKLSICGTKWKFVLLLLGCGLFVSACAKDSTDDNGGSHRHHRHGNGHGRDQTETIDRSDNPIPTPSPGL